MEYKFLQTLYDANQGDENALNLLREKLIVFSREQVKEEKQRSMGIFSHNLVYLNK